MFTKGFDSYACFGESITTEVDGLTITATIQQDEDAGLPWENSDCYGIVSDWTRRDKEPGERIICEDHGARRYYNVQESIKKAKEDGWDAPPYETGTPGERAARAVERDFEILRAWLNNEWFYCGIVLSVAKKGIVINDHAASLWGIEMNYPGTDNNYLTVVANELLDEAVEEGKKTLEILTS